MNRMLILVLGACLALALPAASAQAATDGARAGGSTVTGSWQGGVFGDNGGAAGYTARVTIRKNDRGHLVGRVNYPGTCSGKWVFKGRSGGWFRFTERITRDPAGGGVCVKRVNVKARRDGAKLRVVWTEPASGDSASMLAKHR